MAKTKRHTRDFKERQCGHCKLANKRDLLQGLPHCGYKEKTGKDPDIRLGRCVNRVPNRKN